MEQKLLTIAIPTYNRRDYLEECLNSILQQYDERIEIIVSDNCSQDSTPEYMEEMMKKFPFIRYIRNNENLGADGNFLNCLRKASGRYIQLLSDDDILECNSLKIILNFLNNNKEFTIVELNYANFNQSIEEIKINNFVFDDTEPIIYDKENFGEMLEKVNVSFTFSSTIIFNKRLFEQVKNPEQYRNTNLLQTHILFDMMSNKNCCAILPKAKVLARGGNSGGYNIYKVFIKNWKKVLFNTAVKKGGIPKMSAKIAFDKTMFDFMTYYALGIKRKEITTFKTDHKWRYLLYAIGCKSSWKRLYPIIILPFPILKFIHKLRHRT